MVSTIIFLMMAMIFMVAVVILIFSPRGGDKINRSREALTSTTTEPTMMEINISQESDILGRNTGEKVTGNFRGHNFFVKRFVSQGGKNRSPDTTTIYVAHHGFIKSDITIDFSTITDSIFNFFEGLKGYRKILTDNPEFASVFNVLSKNQEYTRKILNSDIQLKLLRKRTPIVIDSKKISYWQNGLIDDKNKLLGIIDVMVDVAEKLENSN